MKKLILMLSFFFAFTIANSQRLYVVPYYDWSSKTAFQNSPSPLVRGYGFYSDSLSRAYDEVTFYEYAGEYYPIETWADYYYWFINKYWYRFEDPGLYEFYYHAKDDFGMAQYICGHVYLGYFYPSRIILSFPGRSIYVNNLSRRNLRRWIKNGSWVNKNYVPDKELLALHDKNRPKTSETTVDNVRVADRDKLPNNKRDITPGKYNNSRPGPLYRNGVNNNGRNRSSYNSNGVNSRVNYSTNSSLNRTTSGSSSRVSRSTSTNTSRSNVNQSTNSRRTSSGGKSTKR